MLHDLTLTMCKNHIHTCIGYKPPGHRHKPGCWGAGGSSSSWRQPWLAGSAAPSPGSPHTQTQTLAPRWSEDTGQVGNEPRHIILHLSRHTNMGKDSTTKCNTAANITEKKWVSSFKSLLKKTHFYGASHPDFTWIYFNMSFHLLNKIWWHLSTFDLKLVHFHFLNVLNDLTRAVIMPWQLWSRLYWLLWGSVMWRSVSIEECDIYIQNVIKAWECFNKWLLTGLNPGDVARNPWMCEE